jgi:sporulation protein YlmC with PRC-barrel domain
MTFLRDRSVASGKIIGGHSGKGPGPEIMGASTLTGDKVVNGVGETLGEIREIMLDVPTGRIAYVVLEFGGFLGLGDKLFAVPWNALTLDADNECFILNVDKDRLKHAPGFDKDHWPAMAQAEWATEVHRFYNAEPYWRYHS